MWAKNLLFRVVCTIGLVALVASLARDSAIRPRVRVETHSVRAAAARVDAAFQRLWQRANLKPAPPAPELIVAGRMSLVFVGKMCPRRWAAVAKPRHARRSSPSGCRLCDLHDFSAQTLDHEIPRLNERQQRSASDPVAYGGNSRVLPLMLIEVANELRFCSPPI